MPDLFRELLDLILRWVHVVAGIMWIGNSLLYNWLDRNLRARPDAPPGAIGHAWLLHSGGFYFVEKTTLGGATLPHPLHWFKWQAYTTWLSGAALLVVVYYLGGRALLVSPTAQALGTGTAVAVGVALLAGAWLLYDALWSSPVARAPWLAAAVSLALLGGVTAALGRVLSERAVFLHVGAMLGTLMAGNVAMRIMPAQRQLVAAAGRGEPPDPALADRAKRRSIHNNYMTFPVIALMVSNHFPSLYAHPRSWLVLLVLVVAGAGVRHVMNTRFENPRWIPTLTATALAGIAALALLTAHRGDAATAGAASASGGDGPVSFAEVRSVVDRRCTACHSMAPADRTFGAAPGGVAFDTPAQIQAHAERIRARAVVTQTMPLGNKTAMTPAERDLLRRWIAQGAPLP